MGVIVGVRVGVDVGIGVAVGVGVAVAMAVAVSAGSGVAVLTETVGVAADWHAATRTLASVPIIKTFHIDVLPFFTDLHRGIRTVS